MKEEFTVNCEEGVTVSQLPVADQQLIAEFHQLSNNDQKLVKAYMKGLLKVALEFGNEENID